MVSGPASVQIQSHFQSAGRVAPGEDRGPSVLPCTLPCVLVHLSDSDVFYINQQDHSSKLSLSSGAIAASDQTWGGVVGPSDRSKVQVTARS